MTEENAVQLPFTRKISKPQVITEILVHIAYPGNDFKRRRNTREVSKKNRKKIKTRKCKKIYIKIKKESKGIEKKEEIKERRRKEKEGKGKEKGGNWVKKE